MFREIEDGCLNLFVLFVMSVITFMSWVVIKLQTDFNIQQILVALMLALLPFAFLFFLFLGRKYMKVTVPDPFNYHSEPKLLNIIQSSFYKFVVSWYLVYFSFS